MGNDKPPRTQYNNPSTRVTVAFPFSNIRLNDPDERMKELAAVVVELARVLDATVPGGTRELVERAEACRDALDG